jgi:hypothetical protein
MATGEALDAAEVPDRKGLAFSLAGAVLVSLAGFALIFVLIGELSRLVVDPNGCLTPAFESLLPFFSAPLMRVLTPMLPMLMVFPAILVAMRKRRSTSTDRASKF